MKLSGRLWYVANMVTPCNVVADIGTDHGYVPIYLVENKICKKAIAMDINVGPLERAKENIRKENLENCIETRLSDGLEKLRHKESDTVIIAGMGGELMIRILEKGLHILDTVTELILSPHSGLEKVRGYLLENGFSIEDETMLIDEDKYYTIMKISHGIEDAYSEIELKFGRKLIQKKDSVLQEYLCQNLNKYNQILQTLRQNASDKSMTRMDEVKTQIHMIEQTQKYLE